MIDNLIDLGKWVFMYCTDFVINAANLTNTSYYEVNAFLFVFLWPAVTIGLFGYYLYLRLHLHRKKKTA